MTRLDLSIGCRLTMPEPMEEDGEEVAPSENVGSFPCCPLGVVYNVRFFTSCGVTISAVVMGGFTTYLGNFDVILTMPPPTCLGFTLSMRASLAALVSSPLL